MINNVNANASYNTCTDSERKQVRARRKEESYTARANTIADDDKRAVATELKNRILHGDYSQEKRWELSTQFREMVALHGDMHVGIQLPVSMRINVGTEAEPIWAAIRGENIWIHKGHLDDFLSDEARPANWVNPWVKLQDANGLDESVISRLLQYQEILHSVNANAGFVGFPTESEPANSTLFVNLSEAANFFNNNSVAENEDGFRSFVTWLFADRASNAQETALANQLSNQFLDVFFAQLHENSNTEHAFLTAWNSIQSSSEVGGGINIMA